MKNPNRNNVQGYLIGNLRLNERGCLELYEYELKDGFELELWITGDWIAGTIEYDGWDYAFRDHNRPERVRIREFSRVRVQVVIH
jgi:hypothetical protein